MGREEADDDIALVEGEELLQDRVALDNGSISKSLGYAGMSEDMGKEGFLLGDGEVEEMERDFCSRDREYGGHCE